MFRADEIVEGGGRATIIAWVSPTIQHGFGQLEQQPHSQLTLAYGDRVLRGQLGEVSRQTILEFPRLA